MILVPVFKNCSRKLEEPPHLGSYFEICFGVTTSMHKNLEYLGVFGSIGVSLGIVKCLATGGFSLSTVNIRWEVHSQDNHKYSSVEEISTSVYVGFTILHYEDVYEISQGEGDSKAGFVQRIAKRGLEEREGEAWVHHRH